MRARLSSSTSACRTLKSTKKREGRSEKKKGRVETKRSRLYEAAEIRETRGKGLPNARGLDDSIDIGEGGGRTRKKSGEETGK